MGFDVALTGCPVMHCYSDSPMHLLSGVDTLGEQIAVLGRRLVAVARQDGAVRRLMTAPGVGEAAT